MIRTRIQLSDEQAARLKELAHASSKSMAGIIREALDQFLSKQEPDRRTLFRQALTVVGKYKAGVPDGSLEHDRYLEEEFGS